MGGSPTQSLNSPGSIPSPRRQITLVHPRTPSIHEPDFSLHPSIPHSFTPHSSSLHPSFLSFLGPHPFIPSPLTPQHSSLLLSSFYPDILQSMTLNPPSLHPSFPSYLNLHPSSSTPSSIHYDNDFYASVMDQVMKKDALSHYKSINYWHGLCE